MADLGKETEIRWVKQGSEVRTCLMGRDVVVLASELFVKFVETSRPDKKEVLYVANNEVRGDGIHCLCTHGNLPCFAFSELCRNPRIFILSYPSFETIKTFESVTDTNYAALRFSEMEFLVAVTGVPDYKIVIWNWRTTEKLYVQETMIRSPKQIIRISPTSPIQIVQTTGEDRRLFFWDMNLCHKKTLLNGTSLLLPKTSTPPYCFAYGADGDVYAVDSGGSLYSINSETRACSQQYAFSGSSSPEFKPCATWYKGGIVFSTPKEVLFLRRKSPEGWLKIWSFVPKTPFKNLLASPVKDLLVGVNVRNEILVLKGDSQVEAVTVKSFGANFEFVCFVNPLGDFFVTFGNTLKTFSLWNKMNGQLVSHLKWSREKITELRSHPVWPYLVAVSVQGVVYLVNAYEPTQLLELDKIHLTKNSLDVIKFRNQGAQICVANTEIGEFFLLKVPAKIEVIAYVKLELKIADYALLDKEVKSGCLLILPMSQFCCRSGQTVLLYGIDEKEKTFVQLQDVALPSIVTEILPVPNSQKEIFCIPHRSRKVYSMNILTGKVTNEFVSGHQMKFISIQTVKDYLFTFGPDGLVIVKLTPSKKCVTLFSSHHRLAKGIRSLAVDPYAKHAIALGGSGDLVCVLMKKLQFEGERQELEALLASAYPKQLLLAPIVARGKALEKVGAEVLEAASPFKESKPLWLVTRQQEVTSLEEQLSKKERQSIMDGFNDIRQKVCRLLAENLENVPEKQLPVNAFDLDKAARRKKLEDAKLEREKEKQFTLATMKYLLKLVEVIKNHCWESVSVKGRELQGILAPISVQSYALFAENREANVRMIWLAETKKIVDFFKMGDYFEPWVPRTDSELEKHINEKFQVMSLNVIQTIKTKYEEEQMEDEKTEASQKGAVYKYVWSGTSSHNFIEVDQKHFSQFELTTFLQSHQEILFIESDIKKLMQWFNKEFMDTLGLKEREMEFIFQRNNQLRHIIKELSFFNFSPTICRAQIFDPEWAPEENPETILRVLDEEVKAPMYVSPSSLELLKKKEAEEERLRKLLMSDDFKEKALMTMMDGVLEKLWEDEIKKDVPRPKCMVEKDSANYTEDDLKVIKAYEDAVRFLNIERERYRKILEGRWVSTLSALKDSVGKFDEKMAKLHLLKLKVESAIGQETLKGLRIRKRCFEYIELQRRRETIKFQLSKNEKKIESMSVELSKLQEMLNECKNLYEALQNKDKNLEKNFKREFPDYSAMICEQLFKLSKKRPKLPQKAALYSTVLNDLGKCAISGTKPEYMPGDCIQYLKDIDALDPYSNAPASVSQQSWELACKLRRMKIDTELKIRACAIDLADAEATVAGYQKSLKAAKEHQAHLHNDLSAVMVEKANGYVNYQVQIVLKKGLVEIPLTGQISDFDDSVLVTKDTLGVVNREIQNAGRQKIKAMKKAANFRKGIIYKEWEHKKLRMEIEDLKGQLEMIEKLQVLKELQAILVARARGFSDEKGFLYLENELALVKEKFQKTQTEIFSKIDDFDLKIGKLKAKNKELDLKIVEINVEVNEMNLSRDVDFDKKRNEENQRRMKKVREKSRLVREIQERHNEILVLQTELELLRLKTYPTIKYKIS